MSIVPFKPTGIGAVAAQNVFKVTFSQDLSANPKLKAWDDYNMNTVDNKIFTGTTVNSSKSMIGGIGLTAASAAGWWSNSETAGAAVDNASLLRGDDGYCYLSAVAPSAAGAVYFNLNYYIPSDLLPSHNMNHVIGIEYEYTGTAPVVKWYGNRGTEASPDWDELWHGVKGSAPVANMTEIAPCDTGEGYDGTAAYKLTIPSSSITHPAEIWLKNRS